MRKLVTHKFSFFLITSRCSDLKYIEESDDSSKEQNYNPTSDTSEEDFQDEHQNVEPQEQDDIRVVQEENKQEVQVTAVIYCTSI